MNVNDLVCVQNDRLHPGTVGSCGLVTNSHLDGRILRVLLADGRKLVFGADDLVSLEGEGVRS